MNEEKNEINTNLEVPEEEILKQRMDKLLRLRREEGFDPFRNDRWDRKQTLGEVLEDYGHLEPDAHAEGSTCVC